MKIKTTITVVTMAILVAACGKEPPPLMSLPPVKELPKAASQQTSEQEARQKAVEERLGKNAFIVNGDFDRSAAVGKSGKLCSTTCDDQTTLEACKAAITADGCIEARDDWRAKNPDKRGYADTSTGRYSRPRF